MNPPGWGFDPSGDFLLADGIESVRLYRQSSGGDYATPQKGRAIWENPTSKNTNGVFGADRVWHLHRADFPSVPIAAGDVLAAADGSQWIVTRADIAGVQDEWTLQTTRAVGDPLA